MYGEPEGTPQCAEAAVGAVVSGATAVNFFKQRLRWTAKAATQICSGTVDGADFLRRA